MQKRAEGVKIDTISVILILMQMQDGQEQTFTSLRFWPVVGCLVGIKLSMSSLSLDVDDACDLVVLDHCFEPFM